jgi:hypothetical protein
VSSCAKKGTIPASADQTTQSQGTPLQDILNLESRRLSQLHRCWSALMGTPRGLIARKAPSPRGPPCRKHQEDISEREAQSSLQSRCARQVCIPLIRSHKCPQGVSMLRVGPLGNCHLGEGRRVASPCCCLLFAAAGAPHHRFHRL